MTVLTGGGWCQWSAASIRETSERYKRRRRGFGLAYRNARRHEAVFIIKERPAVFNHMHTKLTTKLRRPEEIAVLLGSWAEPQYGLGYCIYTSSGSHLPYGLKSVLDPQKLPWAFRHTGVQGTDLSAGLLKLWTSPRPGSKLLQCQSFLVLCLLGTCLS